MAILCESIFGILYKFRPSRHTIGLREKVQNTKSRRPEWARRPEGMMGLWMASWVAKR